MAAAAAIVAGVVMAAAAPAEQPRPVVGPATNPATKPVDRMVEAAARRMEHFDVLRRRGEGPDDQEEYRWSKRLMKARREAAADAAGRRAAVEAHRDRMAQRLEQTKGILRANVAAGAASQGRLARITIGAVDSLEFYVAEAEHRLAKMDARERTR